MRWSAVMLTVLAASLAAAAGSPDGSRTLQEVVPTTPWTAPVAAGPPGTTLPESRRQPAPASAARVTAAQPAPPAADGSTAEPAVEVLVPRWYEQPRNRPERLYLERLLIGETVDGWVWDAGEDAEALSAELDRPSDTRQLSLGFEHRTERTVLKNKDGEYEDASLVGPRMRWRPTEHTHVDLSPLVGINTPYPMSEVVLVFGWKY